MSTATKAPKHFWIIGIITLLWNMYGAYDYLMTQTENEAHMAHFTQAQLDYFYGFPTWVGAFWALAVWGGLAGCILLLLRRHLAVPVFLGSFVSMVITAIYQYGLSDGLDVMGTAGLMVSLVVFLVSLGLVLYARAMHKQGYLT